MAKRKHFDDVIYRPTKINPDDVIYRSGVERPSDEEIVKEVEKNEFKYSKVAIYMSGAIIVAAVSRVIFGVELSLPILLGLGALVGTGLFFLDKWLARRFKNKPEKAKDEQR